MTDKDELTETIEGIALAPVEMRDDGRMEAKLHALEAQAKQGDGWLDQPTEVVKNALEVRGENRAALIGWVNANLKEGHDFGVIKAKKSLWKAGAEKIAGMLGLQVSWPNLSESLSRLANGSEIIYLECNLLRNGVVQAQGAGARSLSQDGGDPNKMIKMAKKSAMIDAVLNVAGLSEVFTQDLEQEDPNVVLSEDSATYLLGVAERLFPENHEAVLESLARRRFHIGDGDFKKIPGFRLQDAVRSLTEKAEDET